MDTQQAAYVVGSTLSTNFPTTPTAAPQSTYGGEGDAFVASISTILGGTLVKPMGDYSTYLGGGGLDQGTGIAIDSTFGAAYVAGTTASTNFPIPPSPPAPPPYQGTLNGAQNAFVSKLGANSAVVVSVSTNPVSPNPSQVDAGTQVAFTFNITNNGPRQRNLRDFFRLRMGMA